MAIEYDQNVTPGVVMGSGIANGGWSTDRTNGIELGLRAKVRLPVATNDFNSNGDGTYSFTTGGSGSRPWWNFEWSINSDYLATSAATPLSTYTFVLGMDLNPSMGSTYTTYSLGTVADNSFGNNSTANGAGVEATILPGPPPTLDPASYNQLLTTYNVAQNSWSPHWFGAFDPTVDGTYNFYLAAFGQGQTGDQVELARTSIQVIVGNGGSQVPDAGGTLVLLGCALTGLGALRRKFVA